MATKDTGGQRQTTRRTEETEEDQAAATEEVKERHEKLSDDVDAILDEIVAANWDSVVFDLGEGPLQRVPMLDPLRGTRELTEELLETSATAQALLNALDR